LQPAPESLQAPPSPPRFAIDGLEPKRLSVPGTALELGSVLQEANSQGLAVMPFGAGSKQHIGNLPQRFDVALSLERFGQVPDYEPQDLVVKVECGCRLADLQARLAKDNLCLPLDPPSYETATLGGIVASNDSGPLRFSQGTVRDFLIGISVVQPDGASTKFGSRVVKNVTGYDMCKLYTGSFGTLGIFLDFFFKLKPLPPSEKTVLVRLRGLAGARQALIRLFNSPLTPLAVELLNPAALDRVNQAILLTQGTSYALALRFGDVEKAVQWQVEQLEKLCGDTSAQGVIVSDPGEQALFWRMLREDALWLVEPSILQVKLKVNYLPSQLVEVVQKLEIMQAALGAGLRLKAHAGSGVIRAYLSFEEKEGTDSRFARQIHELRAALKPSRGTVIIERAPAVLKRAIDVWGYDFKDRVVMRQIRQRFDPGGILNPGRFVV